MWQESRIGSETLRLPHEKSQLAEEDFKLPNKVDIWSMDRKRLKYANMREVVCTNNG